MIRELFASAQAVIDVPPMKNKIRLLPLSLVILYFALWWGFGMSYRRIANESAGGEFLFQEDLRTSSRIAQLRKLTGLPLDETVVRGVLRQMADSDQEFLPAFGDSDVPVVYGRTLGAAWGRYYLDWAKAQGFSHFRYAVSTPKPGADGHFRIEIGFYRHAVSLKDGAVEAAYHRLWAIDSENPAETHIYLLPTTEQAKTWEVVRKITVWTKQDPRTLKIDDWARQFPREVSTAGIHPIDFVSPLIAAAVSDPDGSVHSVEQVLRGQYKYPVLDFLYFSAVTITTVGYGDILPNSSRVRLLVMVEALLGIICIGAFVSSLFIVGGQKRRPQVPP